MSIEVNCVECNSSHHVNDRLAGRSVRCPSCDAVVAVPEKTAAMEVQATPIIDDGMQQSAAEIPAAERTTSLAEPHEGDSVSIASRETAHENQETPQTQPADFDDDEIDEVLIRKKRPEEEMDMTPMVDVTFLLLIFFMVTAAFSLQKSIRMPRQQTDLPSINQTEEEDDELDSVEVEVDEFGGFLVIAQDWERETPGKQNLITALKEAISASKDGMRLVVKVHEMAKLRSLVDAMDAGTIAGFAELEVTQVDEFN